MASKQHRTVLMEVHRVDNKWQSNVRARLWTVYFKPSNTYKGAIIAANNFVRTYNLRPANRNKVSRRMYSIKKGVV